MFNLGPAEMMLILGLALIVFGPKKLPEIGKGIGNALREFNKARNDFMDSIQAESDRDEDDRRALAAPSYTEPSYSNNGYYSEGYGEEEQRQGSEGTGSLEYPAALHEDSADALPYGSDFHPEGDSQPHVRTSDAGTDYAEAAPAAAGPSRL